MKTIRLQMDNVSMHQFSYSYIATLRHKTLVGQIFDGFGTARKSVEKILVADHTNET